MRTTHDSQIRGVSLMARLFGAVLLVQMLAWQEVVRGEESQPATEGTSTDNQAAETPAARPSRIFARGCLYENSKPQPMGVVSIDPRTGVWKQLIDDSNDGFEVSPDGETITFSRDGALWNGDTATNANPGKVFGEAGRVVFSSDSKSMFVTTWKSVPDKPNESATTVWKMRLNGADAVPIVALAGWDVRDWSSDDRLLTVDKQRTVHVMQSDGKEARQLLKTGEHPCFSPDGQQVMYVHQWKGTIRAIGTDGSNDRLLYQAPGLTFAMKARWSPDGKQFAVVLLDLQIGNDNQPTLTADAMVAKPRIAIVSVATGESRVLKLSQENGREFFPFGHLEWK
jgi:Tol biopolymer transport system component